MSPLGCCELMIAACGLFDDLGLTSLHKGPAYVTIIYLIPALKDILQTYPTCFLHTCALWNLLWSTTYYHWYHVCYLKIYPYNIASRLSPSYHRQGNLSTDQFGFPPPPLGGFTQPHDDSLEMPMHRSSAHFGI